MNWVLLRIEPVVLGAFPGFLSSDPPRTGDNEADFSPSRKAIKLIGSNSLSGWNHILLVTIGAHNRTSEV